jgi:hypothetical protein
MSKDQDIEEARLLTQQFVQAFAEAVPSDVQIIICKKGDNYLVTSPQDKDECDRVVMLLAMGVMQARKNAQEAQE